MNTLLLYLKKHKSLVVLTFILATINQGFALLDPILLGKIIDNYATKTDEYTQVEFIKGAGVLFLCLIGVAMVSRIAKAFQDYTTNLIIQKVGTNIYTDGLEHAMNLPYQAFEDQRSGETLNILQRVKTDIERFVLNFMNVVYFAIVGIVFVIIYSLQIYPLIILVYFVASFVLVTVINILSKKIKKVQTNIVQQTNRLAGATTESLRNIELIKSLGLTEQEINRLNRTTQDILELELTKVKQLRSIAFIQGTIVNFLRQAILFTLLYLIFKDYLTVGKLMTLQFFSFFIFNPLQEMGNVILSYRETQASLSNFTNLLSKPIESSPEVPVVIDNIENLEFRNVSFKHQSATYFALENINFTIQKGNTFAFVGPSGSGKSTLVKLLVGLYQTEFGEILYNNVDSNHIHKDNIRKQISFVSQDTQLFAGTIRQNMLFVNPSATLEEMNEALSQASCNSILSRSEEGIDTIIGEGGMKLSGGEKQRLSIARALLRKPNILVFDEATSALDSLTEEAITQTIQQISNQKNRIVILIAHRLSTIMHAQKIFVLEKGKIVEDGNHAKLIEEKGLYYAMWRQQIGERKL
ncbi:MAG: ABC transporter ATP-binding protein [Sphingobacteriales bacterium]|nr:MAG: ABC transporter ATP-binding protein [Sphingobacteriales bacterium]